MKRIIKKIAVFLCATLIAVCSFGCAENPPADTRTKAQILLDGFITIEEGEYVDGTTINGWTFIAQNGVEKIKITGKGLDMGIEVIEGEYAGYSYSGFRVIDKDFGEFTYFETDYPYSTRFYFDFAKNHQIKC